MRGQLCAISPYFVIISISFLAAVRGARDDPDMRLGSSRVSRLSSALWIL